MRQVWDNWSYLAARLFTAVLGCAAIAWGVALLPVFWRHSAVEQVAAHIGERIPYRIEALLTLMPAVKMIEEAEYCHPAALRAASIIRLRILEMMIEAGARREIDDEMNVLRRSIHISLACSPADGFLWSVLYWLESSRSGFTQSHLNFLRLSYEMGPNEGWIAVRRNGLALAVFNELPRDLGEKALDEFVKLVGNGFYEPAMQAFTGPGWRIHNQLLEKLASASERHRIGFARLLRQRGYDVPVPGVVQPEPRPWL